MTARKTSIQSGPFTVGMELEYWLANPKTRKPANVDSSFVQELKNRLGEKRAANELQKCVAEMTTKPCSKIQ
jgi:gamma-glutamyl:cysteine ligase YbdK (ATP-grasp superfamily)